MRMLIEDLRGDRAGDSALILPGDQRVPAAFHNHATQAHWHTLNSLIRMGGQRVDNASDVIIGIVEWWRTVESLISLLLSVACTESDLGLRPERNRIDRTARRDVHERWSLIANWFSEGTESAPSELTSLLTELRDFRNSFEHSSRANPVAIRASRLSTQPDHVNEADLMEAMAICVAICQFWRFVLPFNDLMPQVNVPSTTYVMFEALDTQADELLWPFFAEVLDALGLEAEVSPYAFDFGDFSGRSHIQAMMAICFEDKPQRPQLSTPIDPTARFEAYTVARPDLPGPGMFRVPAYTITADADAGTA